MKTKHLFLSIAFIAFISGFILLRNDHPVVSISGKSSGQIEHGELIGQKMIVDKSDYTVDSYTIVIGIGSSAFSIDVQGDIVNKNVSNLIRIQSRGTEIVFKNIVLSTLGKVTLAPEMKFVLW